MKHTAIHWWDQPSLLAAVRHQMLCLFFLGFFDAHDKQEETHCLADDAGDARFAPEARQTLGTRTARRMGRAWMKRLRSEHERSCSGEKGTLHSRSHLLGLLRLPLGPANPWDHVGPVNKASGDCYTFHDHLGFQRIPQNSGPNVYFFLAHLQTHSSRNTRWPRWARVTLQTTNYAKISRTVEQRQYFTNY